MFFWWICGEESVLPVLLLHHLSSSSGRCFNSQDAFATKFINCKEQAFSLGPLKWPFSRQTHISLGIILDPSLPFLSSLFNYHLVCWLYLNTQYMKIPPILYFISSFVFFIPTVITWHIIFTHYLSPSLDCEYFCFSAPSICYLYLFGGTWQVAHW